MPSDDDVSRANTAKKPTKHFDPTDAEGMNTLGLELEADGDFGGAEYLFLRAAELDHIDAMINLAFRLRERGQYDDARDWYIRAAELGNPWAMFYLGYLFSNNLDDLGAAEMWYRKAADLGELGAMHNLGHVFTKKGDLASAEEWYRKAAEQGHVSAMDNLATLLEAKGDLENSMSWYKKSAQLDSGFGASKLGYLLYMAGDLEKSEEYYRKGAKLGNTTAMQTVGVWLLDRGELEEAEGFFRQAVESGDSDAMPSLGLALQFRGDLAGAEYWYQKAADNGVVEGATKLKELRQKIVSDENLDAIQFDVFDWKMVDNRENFRAWRSQSVALTETYVGMAPGFPSWDTESIRRGMMETYDFIESPGFNVDDINFPDLIPLNRVNLPERSSLLDVECFYLSGVKCVFTLSRNRLAGRVFYSSTHLILFKTCFWMLGLEIKEEEDVGKREGAIAKVMLDSIVNGVEVIGNFDPYESKWDGLLPIEEDPLTRVRLLSAQLRRSILFKEKTQLLEVFEPDTD